ncbi:MAG: hypothetical protein JWM68_5800 [Verrucomicrobiales bacterium]|nr:hypothetical protein [Verrucomicrobiales bacterium]
MGRNEIKFELTKDEAFSALAVLSRFAYDGGTLDARTDAERQAIIALCQSIDDELVESFRDDYKKFAEHRKDTP